MSIHNIILCYIDVLVIFYNHQLKALTLKQNKSINMNNNNPYEVNDLIDSTRIQMAKPLNPYEEVGSIPLPQQIQPLYPGINPQPHPYEAKIEISIPSPPRLPQNYGPAPFQGNSRYTQQTYPQPYPQNFSPAPAYGQPITAQAPPVYLVHQQTIQVQAGGMRCPVCGGVTDSIRRRVISNQAIIWFIVLLIVFWPLCWIPFVMQSCKAVEFVCIRCGTQKSIQFSQYDVCRVIFWFMIILCFFRQFVQTNST